ncbi:MAG: helix-turn-helix transcriptional regulator [Solirubrobacterales bacterium]|nr:helix-turn-helix transcriptional regulator [Solirubrobacterales bacterium]
MAEARFDAAAERLELKRAFGAKVRERRTAANLTSSGLARRCRLSESTVSKIELGRGGDPSLQIILILCEAFSISPDTLLDGCPTAGRYLQHDP